MPFENENDALADAVKKSQSVVNVLDSELRNIQGLQSQLGTVARNMRSGTAVQTVMQEAHNVGSALSRRLHELIESMRVSDGEFKQKDEDMHAAFARVASAPSRGGLDLTTWS